jgi:hypothetical protein
VIGVRGFVFVAGEASKMADWEHPAVERRQEANGDVLGDSCVIDWSNRSCPAPLPAKARLSRFHRRSVQPCRRSEKDRPQGLDMWRLNTSGYIRGKCGYNSVLTHPLVLCFSGRSTSASQG